MNRGSARPKHDLPVPVRKPGTDLVVQRPRPRIIADFQTDAVELEEKTPPRIARMTLYGVTALIAAAITWASVSEIDEVVVAPGKLITTQPTIIVQPLETSIVRSIDVAAGEIVRAGQTLVTLDATFSQSDVDQQRAKFAALDAQVKRIEAELAGTQYAASAQRIPAEMLQVQLVNQRRAFHKAQLQNFDQQIAGQLASITSAKDQQIILEKRRDNLLEIELVRQKLYEQRNGPISEFLSTRDSRLDVESSLSVLQGRMAEARHAVSKLTAERQAFIEDFRRAAMDQLVELRDQRSAVSEEVKKMELRRNMVALTAPADAVVLDLARLSIGSIAREAEPMVTLVPLNVPLEAELSVNPRDISRIDVDKEVRIKFDAFPFQKFGTATGRLRVISRDTFTSPQQDARTGQAETPFFKALARLSDTRLRGMQEPVRLLPGMTVSAEIKVGRRTVISYFLYPLVRGLDDAIREP
jgi:hemolysin D